MMAEDAGSHEDVRIIIFISYFGLNALLFLINGILSFLEENNIKYISQHKFDGCKNINHLLFDRN